MSKRRASNDEEVAAPAKRSKNENEKVGTTQLPLSMDDLGDAIVELTVGTGKDKKLFRVHQKLLPARVIYFNKMFNGSWKESGELKASFQEDDPSAFGIMLGWVYSGQLPRLLTAHEYCDWDPDHAYVLAAKLCIPELQNAIISALIDVHKVNDMCSDLSSYKIVYKNTSQYCGMRRLLARQVARFVTDERYASWTLEETHQLLIQLPDLQKDVLTIVQDSGGRPEDPFKMPLHHFLERLMDDPSSEVREGDSSMISVGDEPDA